MVRAYRKNVGAYIGQLRRVTGGEGDCREDGRMKERVNDRKRVK